MIVEQKHVSSYPISTRMKMKNRQHGLRPTPLSLENARLHQQLKDCSFAIAQQMLQFKVETLKLQQELKKQQDAIAELQQANQALRDLAALDGLTKVANRRRFDEYLAQEWRRLARDRGQLSLIFCDVDCFKLYNDTYGHLMGDDCLRAIAQAIRSTLKRPADLVARYGGEEFVVILPNTFAAGAMQVAQEIQSAILQLQIPHARSIASQQVTVSLGIASQVASLASTPETLIALADRALYNAKGRGRNCIVLH